MLTAARQKPTPCSLRVLLARYFDVAAEITNGARAASVRITFYRICTFLNKSPLPNKKKLQQFC
jgi:hypothetical protein